MRLASSDALLPVPAANSIAANGSAAASCSSGSKLANSATGLVPDNAALLIEGALCPEYYAVRDLLYGQYHIC